MLVAEKDVKMLVSPFLRMGHIIVTVTSPAKALVSLSIAKLDYVRSGRTLNLNI